MTGWIDPGALHRIITAAFGAAAISTLMPAAARAQSEPVVVVELYTSQGCSSCPPADEFMALLAVDDRVVPLALHVDYWDYIGWADSFAAPAYTKRQKAYARAADSRTIYTPQMIVGGLDRVEGNRPPEVEAFIDTHLHLDRAVDLTLTRDGGKVVIAASADRALPGPLEVQIVRYDPEETVAIHRGENAGLTMTYHNVVTEWTALGEWNGAEPLRISAPAPGDSPVVVILQEKGPGLIVAAARLR